MDKSYDRSHFSMKWPFRVLLCGPSGVGKTFLVTRMVENSSECMTQPPKSIHIFFNHMQECYNEIKSKTQCPVYFHSEPPSDEFVSEKGSLVIFDDLQGQKKSTELVRDFFIRKSHHMDTSVCYICQSLYDTRDPSQRVISDNSTYKIIFNNPGDRAQITTLSSRIYPGQRSVLVNALDHAVADGSRYLVIDCDLDTPRELRLRSTLFPDSDFPKAAVYIVL